MNFFKKEIYLTVITNEKRRYMEEKRLLIIRGWRSKKEHWKKVIEKLENNGFEVISPDPPGFTERLPLKKPWKVDDYKDWFLNYTSKKGWEEFDVLGHSFGGAVAVKLAKSEPKKVKRLILVAPALFGTKSPKTVIFYIIAKLIQPFFCLPIFRKKSAKIKKKLSLLGIKEYYFEKGVMGKTLRNLSKENFKKILPFISQETLIIWGKDDKSISPKYAKKIKKILNKAKLIIFQNTGHHPHINIPEKFSETIIKFLK